MIWAELKQYAMKPGFTSSEWFVSSNYFLNKYFQGEFCIEDQEKILGLIERQGVADSTAVKGTPWSLLKWEVMDPLSCQESNHFDIDDVSFLSFNQTITGHVF